MKMAFVTRCKEYISVIKEQLEEMHHSSVETEKDAVIDGGIFVCDSFEDEDGWIVIRDVIPDKKDAIILDHSDTHLRLGFVTDIDEKYDCLDDGKPKEKTKSKEKEEPLPKECPKCHFLKPAKVFLCPSCGFKPEKQTDIVNEKGELAELTGKTANKKYTPEQKKQFYGELIWYGRYKGYKPGWAANQYRAKFGVWPNAHKDARISQPTDLSLGFIKHINIKNAYRARA
jgi:hypothetical protein